MNGVCDSCGAAAEVNDEKLCVDCAGDSSDDMDMAGMGSDDAAMDMGDLDEDTVDDM